MVYGWMVGGEELFTSKEQKNKIFLLVETVEERSRRKTVT